MTDEQVEAATDMLAKMLASLKLPHDGIRAMAHHILAAAEAVARKGRWYSDEEGGYESVDDAVNDYGLSLGQSIVLSENITISEERWQVVPVTGKGDLCPCGKAEGCGDFLGMECEADRDTARRWAELPKEWRR